MAWIKTISFDDAEEPLKSSYDRVKGPDNNVDNILEVHSLRPHTLIGHIVLYKNVLHNSGNTLPKWFMEAIGVYVSVLNNCEYCVRHHHEGLKKLIDDDKKADKILSALEVGKPVEAFEEKELQALKYAAKLTESSAMVSKKDIEKLRDAGYQDGEILEINQVVAYFNYANRTVSGLGVNTEGDVLGLSPNDSDDPENWQHS